MFFYYIFTRRYTVFFLILFAALFPHLPLKAATLSYFNGFESGNLNGLGCSGNCPKITKSPTANGKYAADFTLTRKMPTPFRTEIVVKRGYGTFAFNQEYWLSFNYRLENWAKDRKSEIAPMQVHTSYLNWDSKCQFGSAVSRAPLLMLTELSQTTIKVYGKDLGEVGVQSNKWRNAVFHFVFSYNNNGFVEAWVDGKKIGRINGANSPKVDNCRNPMQSPVLKLGVYKWDWKEGRPATDTSRRQLFIDDLKVAEGSSGYSLMTSNSQQASTVAQPQTSEVEEDLAISNVQVDTTETTATISWDTTKPTNSIVDYGLSKSYGSRVRDDDYVTTHSLTLKNLSRGTQYYYKAFGVDRSENPIRYYDSFVTSSSASSSSAASRAASSSESGGLIAHWAMNSGSGKTVIDNSGNGHTGILVNGASLTDGDGVQFDGRNDYLDVGNLNLSGNEATIAGWIWLEDLSQCPYQDCRIISKSRGGTSSDAHYFMISTVGVGSQTRLRFRLKTNGQTSTLVASSGNVGFKKWIHVAATYDGKTMRLYQDGREVGSMLKSGSITTNQNASVWIGGNPNDASARPWKGYIDDVRVYDYPLTSNQIDNLAN